MADELEGFGDGEFGRGDRDDVPAGADGPGGVGGTAQDERGELGGQLFRRVMPRSVVSLLSAKNGRPRSASALRPQIVRCGCSSHIATARLVAGAR